MDNALSDNLIIRRDTAGIVENLPSANPQIQLHVSQGWLMVGGEEK
jgi:hypothetical protein